MKEITFEQYTNNPYHVRLPDHSVYIDNPSIVNIWHTSRKFAGNVIDLYQVHLLPFNTVYTCENDSLMFTQDDHGNKKSASVFKINPKLLFDVRNTALFM